MVMVMLKDPSVLSTLSKHQLHTLVNMNTRFRFVWKAHNVALVQRVTLRVGPPSRSMAIALIRFDVAFLFPRRWDSGLMQLWLPRCSSQLHVPVSLLVFVFFFLYLWPRGSHAVPLLLWGHGRGETGHHLLILGDICKPDEPQSKRPGKSIWGVLKWLWRDIAHYLLRSLLTVEYNKTRTKFRHKLSVR